MCLAGGVAANGRLRQLVNDGAQKLGAKVYLPELKFCGDNGAMIAAQGYYQYIAGPHSRAGAERPAHFTHRLRISSKKKDLPFRDLRKDRSFSYAKYSCARCAALLMQARSSSSVSNFLLGLR